MIKKLLILLVGISLIGCSGGVQTPDNQKKDDPSEAPSVEPSAEAVPQDPSDGPSPSDPSDGPAPSDPSDGPEPGPGPDPFFSFCNLISSKDWTDVDGEYGDLPDGITVFRSPEKLLGKSEIAYIAVADLSKIDFNVWSIKDIGTKGTKEAFKTPAKVYQDGKQPVIINGGFFFSDSGKNYSASLAVSNSELLATNITYTSQDWVTVWNPTRGAFIQHTDGSYEAAWTYFISETAHYVYQNPAANSWSKEPLKTPTATFPERAKKLNALNAIGGGPVLLKNGEIRNTVVEEMFDGPSGILGDSEHPRTAIGISSEWNCLVLFVNEGRKMTPGVQGLTHADVADILLDLGCSDALNLDGGGSSCMLVNGQETIKPSDGSQRAVASTVMLTPKE